jgi:hypothetical protein
LTSEGITLGIPIYNWDRLELNFSNRTPYDKVIKLQNEFAKKVIARDNFTSNVEFICGVDVLYRKKMAYC